MLTAITYDWEADSNQIGLAKTTKLGTTPWNFQAQVQYFAEQPDVFEPEWLLKFSITPVIKNPFVTKGLNSNFREVKMKQPNMYPGGRPQRCVLHRFKSMLLLAGALLLAIAVPVAAADGGGGDRVEWFGGAPSDRWVYGGEFYLWGADVGGETTSGAPVDIDFNDLFDDLELAFMGTLAAAKGKWTLFADLIYLDVEDDTNSTVNILGTPVPTEVDVELKGFITTLGGAYSFLDMGTTRINLVAGARYLWLEADLDVDIGPVSGDGSESDHVWDGIVGLRGKTDLNEKWYLTYYADVGAGDSDLTWQALAAISYRFEKVDAVVGYRYLEWDFDDGDMLNFDELDLSGPFAGVKIRF